MKALVLIAALLATPPQDTLSKVPPQDTLACECCLGGVCTCGPNCGCSCHVQADNPSQKSGPPGGVKTVWHDHGTGWLHNHATGEYYHSATGWYWANAKGYWRAAEATPTYQSYNSYQSGFGFKSRGGLFKRVGFGGGNCASGG